MTRRKRFRIRLAANLLAQNLRKRWTHGMVRVLTQHDTGDTVFEIDVGLMHPRVAGPALSARDVLFYAAELRRRHALRSHRWNR